MSWKIGEKCVSNELIEFRSLHSLCLCLGICLRFQQFIRIHFCHFRSFFDLSFNHRRYFRFSVSDAFVENLRSNNASWEARQRIKLLLNEFLDELCIVVFLFLLIECFYCFTNEYLNGIFDQQEMNMKDLTVACMSFCVRQKEPFFDLKYDILINWFFALSYAREFPDPYLGHGIGPVPGYGVSLHQQFAFIMNRRLTFCAFFLVFPDGHVSWKLQSIYTILEIDFIITKNKMDEMLKYFFFFITFFYLILFFFCHWKSWKKSLCFLALLDMNKNTWRKYS